MEADNEAKKISLKRQFTYTEDIDKNVDDPDNCYYEDHVN